MKKLVAMLLIITTLVTMAIPAMALDGGYDAVSQYLSTSTLKKGYGTFRAVCNLQYMLEYLGYDPGVVDGIYGNQTAEAVSEFQDDVGLDVDGMCGRDTKIAIWISLDKVPPRCY